MQLKRPQVELALGIAGFRTLLLCGAILFRLCVKERELEQVQPLKCKPGAEVCMPLSFRSYK